MLTNNILQLRLQKPVEYFCSMPSSCPGFFQAFVWTEPGTSPEIKLTNPRDEVDDKHVSRVYEFYNTYPRRESAN